MILYIIFAGGGPKLNDKFGPIKFDLDLTIGFLKIQKMLYSGSGWGTDSMAPSITPSSFPSSSPSVNDPGCCYIIDGDESCGKLV